VAAVIELLRAGCKTQPIESCVHVCCGLQNAQGLFIYRGPHRHTQVYAVYCGIRIARPILYTCTYFDSTDR
jgi:hypothetical protein